MTNKNNAVSVKFMQLDARMQHKNARIESKYILALHHVATSVNIQPMQGLWLCCTLALSVATVVKVKHTTYYIFIH